MAIADQVSRRMLDPYSHVRLEAKRPAPRKSPGGQKKSLPKRGYGTKRAKKSLRSWKRLQVLVGAGGFEPPTSCSQGRLAASTVFSQLLPFVALTRFWGVCFRSQRLRLARLRGVFSDGFLTVVAATAMLYGLRRTCCSNGF